MEFRLLKASEIDCRVQQVKAKGCSVLLYKDARVDMSLLDETVGSMRWKRTHEFKNDRLYCTVSIYDSETSQWVSKEDVGVESNTEQEKGQASDSFKRACVNWGIGRELYTSPFIWITLQESEVENFNGKFRLKGNVKFSVKEIDYNDDREISKLVIVDQNNDIRFTYPKVFKKESKPKQEQPKENKEEQEKAKLSLTQKITEMWLILGGTSDNLKELYQKKFNTSEAMEIDMENLTSFEKMLEKKLESKNNG
jgi:Uncharacterized protein conserved in bacteria